MRVGVAAAAILFALVEAAFWFFGSYDVDPPGGRSLWFGTPLAAATVAALAVATGAVVRRAWAPLLALAPFALAIPLHLAGNRSDFHDPYLPLENPFLYPGIAVVAALLGLGAAGRALVGRLWTTPRPARSSRAS